MPEGKSRTAIGFSIVALTKKLMEHYSLDHEAAFKKLIGTKTFQLIDDVESGMYLEPDEYLLKACLLELEQGEEAMYNFINRE